MDRKPVVQKPRSVTSPLPKDGSTPNITENKYISKIPIMSAYMIMVAFIFVMINFIVDITYYFIDPRIRLKEENS